jgi:hypothetical protein
MMFKYDLVFNDEPESCVALTRNNVRVDLISVDVALHCISYIIVEPNSQGTGKDYMGE